MSSMFAVLLLWVKKLVVRRVVAAAQVDIAVALALLQEESLAQGREIAEKLEKSGGKFLADELQDDIAAICSGSFDEILADRDITNNVSPLPQKAKRGRPAKTLELPG